MRKMITFLSIILFQMACVLTYMYIKTNDVELNYLITTYGQCLVGNDRFRVFQGFSITDCVVECGLRPHCMALNYIDKINVCELLSSDNGKETNNGNCLHVKRSDIRYIKIPCNSCVKGQACDRHSKRCKPKECITFPTLQNGNILGNRKEVGMTLRYTCKRGFKEIKGVNGATCLNSGNWNQTAECVRDCGEPSALSDASILDGGTTEGSTRTIICDVDDSSAIVTCLNNGTWSPQFACPVCKTDWVFFSGSCYLFSTEKLHWDAAKNDCESKGSALVSVKDDAIHQFITGKLQEMSGPFWIGGRYDDTTESFLWLDGSSVTNNNWVPYAPFTMNGCMMYIADSDDWKWVQTGCNEIQSWFFICEDRLE